ncbi:hypothetical protein CES85_0786 [Ochrobactrum quorumnocens]|uniref:Uncharacterized protein n=1 Tax=Ochrobactrum quorumnocens TaxID=271865 RepID=A0A248UKP8_9HYPH|nr:hypothetical protein CES85_0786 [[Ochrobactrum] quorumnocens]
MFVGSAVIICFYALSDAKPLRTFAGNALERIPKSVKRFSDKDAR